MVLASSYFIIREYKIYQGHEKIVKDAITNTLTFKGYKKIEIMYHRQYGTGVSPKGCIRVIYLNLSNVFEDQYSEKAFSYFIENNVVYTSLIPSC